MRPGSAAHTRADPPKCAGWLNGGDTLTGTEVDVRAHNENVTVYGVRFEPPPTNRLPGYPAEEVRVTMRARDSRLFAAPKGTGDRKWFHRNISLSAYEIGSLGIMIPWELLLGSLCLEYERDPVHLRWSWTDGFDAYIRIVQRHLWFEEYWRRSGHWPVEDTPHI